MQSLLFWSAELMQIVTWPRSATKSRITFKQKWELFIQPKLALWVLDKSRGEQKILRTWKFWHF